MYCKKRSYILILFSKTIVGFQINCRQCSLPVVAMHNIGIKVYERHYFKDAFAEKFFVLSSGLAGEILQKFVNYHFKVAIYGDFSKYTSKPLKDFIYESNNGNAVFFTETQAQAVEKLSAAK